MKKAILLLSGGLDSATCGIIARGMGLELYALSFAYGQRHGHELLAAQRVAGFLGVREHRIIDIDLAALGGSALTSDSINVPKGGGISTPQINTSQEHGRVDGDASNIPITYVPARNTIFLSYALAWAEVLGGMPPKSSNSVDGPYGSNGPYSPYGAKSSDGADSPPGSCRDIFIGVNNVDYSGYPDCRPEYIAAFQKMANLATVAGISGREITIHTPLMSLPKAEIIKIGVNAGFDYGMTHSCYDPAPKDGLACGDCDSCRIRKKGFEQAGIPDPTRY